MKTDLLITRRTSCKFSCSLPLDGLLRVLFPRQIYHLLIAGIIRRRRELWGREPYLCLEVIVKSTIGVHKTFVLTSPIYGVLESRTKLGDTTQYLGLGIIGDGSRKISQLLVAFDEKSVNILLQLRQAVK